MPYLEFTPGPRLTAARQWCESQPEAAGMAVLTAAVDAGRIAVTVIIGRRTIWSPRDLRSRLPTIVLIGDDYGDPRDPAEWRCSMSAIAWARSALVHGTGAKASHYRAAVAAAEATGRCVLIETDSAHAPAWAAAIAPRAIPTMILIPPPGAVHPVEATA